MAVVFGGLAATSSLAQGAECGADSGCVGASCLNGRCETTPSTDAAQGDVGSPFDAAAYLGWYFPRGGVGGALLLGGVVGGGLRLAPQNILQAIIGFDTTPLGGGIVNLAVGFKQHLTHETYWRVGAGYSRYLSDTGTYGGAFHARAEGAVKPAEWWMGVGAHIGFYWFGSGAAALYVTLGPAF